MVALAIGLKTKKMELKDSWMPQKMYFGSGMTMITHGIKEDFKEEEPEKVKEKEKDEKEKEKDEKEKEKVVDDFSDQETKEKEKEKVILLKMKATMPMKNGKDMKMKIGMKTIGPTKTWPSQGWDEWQEYDEYGYFQGKGKKGKGKGKKGHGPQDQGKGQGDGKGRSAASSSTFVCDCLWFLCDTFTCVLDIKKTESGEQSMEPEFSGCAYVDKHDCGLCYKIEETSSRFFFANSQQTKCAEKLVIHMYDKAWNVRTTEFDIVEEGHVPLLMSLPQMRSLGFQFELSPQKSFLN